MKLRVARTAVADLDEIWAYLAENESVQVAERLMDLLTRRFSLLAKNPGVGRSRSDLREGLRSFPVANYQIFYRQERKGIVRIVHVRHAARDERELFGYPALTEAALEAFRPLGLGPHTHTVVRSSDPRALARRAGTQPAAKATAASTIGATLPDAHGLGSGGIHVRNRQRAPAPIQ